MPLLAEHFQVFAVDLRGQGRSTRTPGRYTLDNMGNDLVRFIDVVIGRPTHRQRPVVRRRALGVAVGVRQARSGRRRRTTRTRRCSRPRSRPAIGPGIRQCIGPMFDLWSTYLGDQWSIGAWDAMRAAAPDAAARAWMRRDRRSRDEPPQNLKEYDPEWGRAFWTGTVAAVVRPRADAAQRQGRRCCSPTTSASSTTRPACCSGRCPTSRPQRVQELLTEAGVARRVPLVPDVGHSMHGTGPELYVDTLLDWTATLDALTGGDRRHPRNRRVSVTAMESRPREHQLPDTASAGSAPTPPPAREPTHAERVRTLVHGGRARRARRRVAVRSRRVPVRLGGELRPRRRRRPAVLREPHGRAHAERDRAIPRASLLVTEPVPEGADPLASGRVTLLGLAHADRRRRGARRARARYLEANQQYESS